MKEKLILSFSGGRTSAYMTKRMLEEYSDVYDMTVIFANTGMEHEKTLEFVHNCDVTFNFNTIWVESKVYQDERKGTGYTITNFKDAHRGFDLFESVIKKYGIFNHSYPHCTRELKLAPIYSYLKDNNLKDAKHAIGIRSDELRRVKDKSDIIYPLVHLFPTDKIDVLDFWEDQPFDLNIEEFEGNCIGCHKKSFWKTFEQIKRYPEIFEGYLDLENRYKHLKSTSAIGRLFHKKHTPMEQVIFMAKDYEPKFKSKFDAEANSGCSESCELFETT